MAKKNAIDMGLISYDSYDWDARSWCLNNGITISPLAKSSNSWFIVITNKGKIATSPEHYGKTIIWQKIFTYYKYYYEQYKK